MGFHEIYCGPVWMGCSPFTHTTISENEILLHVALKIWNPYAISFPSILPLSKLQLQISYCGFLSSFLLLPSLTFQTLRDLLHTNTPNSFLVHASIAHIFISLSIILWVSLKLKYLAFISPCAAFLLVPERQHHHLRLKSWSLFRHPPPTS